MSSNVDEVISGLRDLYSVQTDAELARSLKIDKSTVSSWRSRKSVPRRFQRLLDEDPSNLFRKEVTPQVIGEFAPPAMPIAVLRFSLLLNAIEAETGSADEKFSLLTNKLSFHSVLLRSAIDVWERRSALNVSPETAAFLVLQDDLRDENATRERAKANLHEDARHNPGVDLPIE